MFGWGRAPEGALKLIVGMEYLTDPHSHDRTLRLTDGKRWSRRWPIAALDDGAGDRLGRYAERVAEILVGYVEIPDLDFLHRLPNVRTVWSRTSHVKDVSGLRHLTQLEDLALDRPTCPMDVLGDLSSLRRLYLDDWRPGAGSLFKLLRLRRLGAQKFGLPDLTGLSHWQELEELSLNGGKLESLVGLPPSTQKIDLSSLRRFTPLRGVERCRKLERLILDGCRQIDSLDGLEYCRELQCLSLANCGPFRTLDPLRGMERLEYVVLVQGAVDQNTDISALYTLPGLRTLIISRRSGLDPARIRQVAPGCDVRLVR